MHKEIRHGWELTRHTRFNFGNVHWRLSVIFVCVIIPFSSISLKWDDLLNRNANKRGIVPPLCYFVAHLESLRTKLSLLNSNSALNEACRMIVTWLTADVELLLWVTFTLTLVLFLWKKSRMKNFKIFYFFIFFGGLLNYVLWQARADYSGETVLPLRYNVDEQKILFRGK